MQEVFVLPYESIFAGARMSLSWIRKQGVFRYLLGEVEWWLFFCNSRALWHEGGLCHLSPSFSSSSSPSFSSSPSMASCCIVEFPSHQLGSGQFHGPPSSQGFVLFFVGFSVNPRWRSRCSAWRVGEK